MKKSLLIVGLALVSGLYFTVKAQVDPGTTNLANQWTFTSDYSDAIGGITGVPKFGAIIENGALVLPNNTNAWLEITGVTLNQYVSGFSLVAWFQSTSNRNNSMLCFLGSDTINSSLGDHGVFMTTKTRAGISTSGTAGWNHETSTNTITSCENDGLDHCLVGMVDLDSIYIYLDGVYYDAKSLKYTNSGGAFSVFPDYQNAIDSLSNDFSAIGKSGYTSDETWQGKVYEFRIYSATLIPDEILYLSNLTGEITTKIGAVSSKTLQNVFVKNNQIAVNFTLDRTTNMEFAVFNVQGKLVSKQKATYRAGANHILLKTDLSRGVYFVTVSRDGNSRTYKVIK